MAERFKNAEIELEPLSSGTKITGTIVWKGFARFDELERQEMLWRLFDKALSQDDRRKLSLIVTASKSVPNFLNCLSASLVANSPPNTIATTDAVPTSIPSNANIERNFAENKFNRPSFKCDIHFAISVGPHDMRPHTGCSRCLLHFTQLVRSRWIIRIKENADRCRLRRQFTQQTESLGFECRE